MHGQVCPRCHEVIKGEVTYRDQGTLDGCTGVRKMGHVKADGHRCSAYVGVPMVLPPDPPTDAGEAETK